MRSVKRLQPSKCRVSVREWPCPQVARPVPSCCYTTLHRAQRQWPPLALRQPARIPSRRIGTWRKLSARCQVAIWADQKFMSHSGKMLSIMKRRVTKSESCGTNRIKRTSQAGLAPPRRQHSPAPPRAVCVKGGPLRSTGSLPLPLSSAGRSPGTVLALTGSCAAVFIMYTGPADVSRCAPFHLSLLHGCRAACHHNKKTIASLSPVVGPANHAVSCRRVGCGHDQGSQDSREEPAIEVLKPEEVISDNLLLW